MTIAQSDMIQVDWVAFAREIKARKLSLGKIAYGIGRSHDYLTGKSRNDAPLPFEDVKKLKMSTGLKLFHFICRCKKIIIGAWQICQLSKGNC